MFEPELHRIRANLLAGAGDRVAAAACYRQAVAQARQQGSRHWELRAGLGLAGLLQGEGKSADARDLLAPVYGAVQGHGDTHDLQACRALLERLEADD